MTDHQRAIHQQESDISQADLARLSWELSQTSAQDGERRALLEDMIFAARRRRDYHQTVANHGTAREGTSERP